MQHDQILLMRVGGGSHTWLQTTVEKHVDVVDRSASVTHPMSQAERTLYILYTMIFYDIKVTHLTHAFRLVSRINGNYDHDYDFVYVCVFIKKKKNKAHKVYFHYGCVKYNLIKIRCLFRSEILIVAPCHDETDPSIKYTGARA